MMDEAFEEWHKGKRKWVDGWNATKFTTDGYNEYYEKWSEQDLTDMLLCNRNHPSIILWSIGNEIDYPNDPFPANEISLVTEAIRLRDIVKKYDISRPVTAACAGPEVNIFKDYLDVIGYNYKEGLYEQEHSRYPYKIFTGSENGKKLSAWLAVRDNPFISSQFLWTGIDYLGEAPRWYDEKKKQYGRGSRSGLLDLAGFPKPSYYQRMAWWSDKPFVYLHKVNDDKITCYSNCTTVELYEDNKSLGVFEIPETKEISIENPRGKVYKAVGFIARVNVSEYMMGMPGEPAKLIATADTRKMILDGRDIAHVELFVVDKNGVPVGDAEVLVGVSIEGPAKILGIENGNQGDMLPYSKTNKTTYNGRLLVYVQSENKPGDITLNFIAEGFEPVSIVIDSQMPMDTKIW